MAGLCCIWKRNSTLEKFAVLTHEKKNALPTFHRSDEIILLYYKIFSRVITFFKKSLGLLMWVDIGLKYTAGSDQITGQSHHHQHVIYEWMWNVMEILMVGLVNPETDRH